jgi:hypothetical protein
MARANQAAKNTSGTKAKTGKRAEATDDSKLGKLGKYVVAAVGVLTSISTALFPVVTKGMDKVTVKKFGPAEAGGWEGVLTSTMTQDLLQWFTTGGCIFVIGYALFTAYTMGKNPDKIKRKAVWALATAMLSIGVFYGVSTYRHLGLVDAAQVETQRVEASSGRVPTSTRQAIAARVVESAYMVIPDFFIGLCYFIFFAGLSRALVMLTMYGYFVIETATTPRQ